jgi:hypothetical protein
VDIVGEELEVRIVLKVDTEELILKVTEELETTSVVTSNISSSANEELGISMTNCGVSASYFI